MIKTTIALLSTALIAGLSAQAAATPSDDNTTVDTLAETSKYDVENWQVTQPPFKLNEVAISTNETTWSSLDVSPNGKFMIFDMLGDLYKVDIKGGNATPLIQDFAWNIHPAISPDGKQVAFVSDRDGLSNVWVMDIDGTHLKQITREKKNIIHYLDKV